jgi:MOSC domain-containing protein YiiM
MAGSTGEDVAKSVATAADGSVYIAGLTNGSIDGQSNHGGVDGFVTKYSANGTKQWTRLLGVTGGVGVASVYTAANGSLYVAGFTTTASIDGQANHGGLDGFVTKFAANGAKQWTRFVGGTGDDTVSSVATAANGSVYVAGTSSGSIDGQVNHGSGDGFVTQLVVT